MNLPHLSLCTLTAFLVLSPAASAQTYILDFDSLPDGTLLYDDDDGLGNDNRVDVLSGDTQTGFNLANPIIHGNGGAGTPNGTDNTNPPAFSGTPIGDLWSSLGITITATGSVLGLVDSHDYTGLSNGGDTDLATGQAYLDSPLFGGSGQATTTTPLGNLLILEENPGDDTPDDDSGGGTITFSIDQGVSASLRRFTFVDDVDAHITLIFRLLSDPTNDLSDITRGTSTDEYAFAGAAENQVFSLIDGQTNPFAPTGGSPLYTTRILDFDAPINYELDQFTITFDGSGGLGEVEFGLLSTVPEASAGNLGTLFFGLVGAGWIIRRRRS